MKQLRRVRLGRYSISLVYLVLIGILATTALTFGAVKIRSQNTPTASSESAQQITSTNKTIEEGLLDTTKSNGTPDSDLTSNESAENPPQTNGNSSQPRSKPAGQCTSATITSNQNFYLSADQKGTTFTFSSPNGRFINTAMAGEPGPYAPKLQGSLGTTVKMYVQYVDNTPTANRGSMLFYTDCEKYTVTYLINKEPTVINVTTFMYSDSTNNVTYEVDAPLSRLDISFFIANCQSQVAEQCFGSDSVYTSAQFGVFSLSTYFPEIATYFANYPSERVYLQMTPVPARNMTVGTIGFFDFQGM